MRKWIFWILALVFLCLSWLRISDGSIGHQQRVLQRRLSSRERVLSQYIDKALETPPTKWPSFKDFPEDMVIYKYNADTIQSWANLFPIANDEVDVVPAWYRIHDLTNRNLFNTPLAYLGEGTQYANLGTGWYVVKVVRMGQMKVVAGLLVETVYVNENSKLSNSTNPRLRIDAKFSPVPLMEDDAHVIYSISGEPLFSIAHKESFPGNLNLSWARWLALLMVVCGLFNYQYGKKTTRSLNIVLASLLVIYLLARGVLKTVHLDFEIFSPMLYADGGLFPNLAMLLLTTLFVCLGCLSIFLSRRDILRRTIRAEGSFKEASRVLIPMALLLLLIYIHVCLKSLILSSTINLELYQITSIDIYSLIVYLQFALLFVGVFFLLYLTHALYGIKLRSRKTHKHISVFSAKPVFYFLLLISLYMLLTISSFSSRKEYGNMRVKSAALANERDFNLEWRLIQMETDIMNDPLISRLIGLPHAETMLRNRLAEFYFWDLLPKYDLRISVCSPGDNIITENYQHPVDCFSFFRDDIVGRYGVQLARNSRFYFLANLNDRNNYIGVLPIFRAGRLYYLYLEMDSIQGGAATGYPSALLSNVIDSNSEELEGYSYAKYHNGKIASHRGSYDFPITMNPESFEMGFGSYSINGYTHFVNRVSRNNLIVISRHNRTILAYLVTFSYIVLFMSLVFLCFYWAWYGGRLKSDRPRSSSLRRKITILETVSLLVVTATLGMGTIIISARLVESSNRSDMEERLSSVQEDLASIMRYSRSLNDVSSTQISGAVSRLSASLNVDINLFDATGALVYSSCPDVFNQFLVSARVDPEAYREIAVSARNNIFLKRRIGSIDYTKLYAPVYNIDGRMVCIVNIPYFVGAKSYSANTTAVVAAIINVVLLLMVAAVMVGIIVSNQVSRPLKKLGQRMKQVNLNSKPEYIHYRGSDELGQLVEAYNKMVDDLEVSTRKLAQSEREQAWKEMARQIAHEIKNPLTPMKLSIQYLVRMKKMGDERWKERFDALSESLIEQIDILSDTASEFSSFAKFYTEEETEFDLAALLEEQKVLYEGHDGVEFRFECDVPQAMVKARRSQLHRVFVNLITNGIQAVEKRESGGLVRVRVLSLDNSWEVKVEDNGSGVSEENLGKLFQPNFTTKSSGTGLGLAISRNIVDQSNGSIQYSTSEELGGACFTVILPKI